MLDAFDLEAWLANWLLDRTSAEAIFASLKVGDDDVPNLTHYKNALDAVREGRALLESPAEIDYSFKMAWPIR
jgi:hypothetical protein